MLTKQTLAGVLVLAVLGAGVYWVRIRPSHADGAAAMPAAASHGGMAGAAAGDAALPGVTVSPASVDVGDTRLTFVLAPQPPVAYAPIHVRVRAEQQGQAVPVTSAKVMFEMVMPMGDHNYTLVAGQDGWLEADVTLPLCPSGNRRWFATVLGTVAGQPRTAKFSLDLTPPTK